MPCGLTNTGVTFQRVMDVDFVHLINLIMVVYQDDLMAYSNNTKDHCMHLEKVFYIAFEYGISLNPEKGHFVIIEGKILGYIVSKEGVRIDPKKVMATDRIPIPKTIKAI